MNHEDANGAKPDARASLRARHREILRRTLIGETAADIARALGVTREGIGMIQRSPLFEAALEEMQREADNSVVDAPRRLQLERKLLVAAEKGAEVALGIMSDEKISPAVRSKNAFGFLDRSGFSPSRKYEQQGDYYRTLLEQLDEVQRSGATVEAAIRITPKESS